MKVSLKWLSEYVDITAPLEKLAERLTMAGVEVNETQVIGAGWENIVVGKIVSVDAHPNADRLRLATVDLGKQQITVVCGAPNLAVGDKVVFAYVGAQLVDGHTGEIIQLKPANIRGIASEGMVCSEKELGISDRHEGIMVLSPEAPIGAPLSEYLGDAIFDLDITPNRPDCLSVIGIAREVTALTGNKLHIPEVHYGELEDAIDSFASVEIIAPDLCPRYCASLLTGVKVAPSPQWLQQRLFACGMRPINNIVDVTNYVMLEYGQPLHAFDYGGIRGKQIIVRRAGEGETITTLDGVERILNQNILVIADKERAIAIAGIMGGLDTEVTDDTTTILIESANFNQAVIHRGSISLRLSSEASLRFEKGLSRDLPLVALKRATQLMLELSGGKVARGLIDVYPGKQQREPILLSTAQVKRLLGIEVDVSEMVKVLRLLGFGCEQTESSSQVRVNVPWWRTDINCTADLVEEVARIIGYDSIPTTMLSAPLPIHKSMPMLSLRHKLRSTLVSCGFQEVLTYSLTSSEMMSKLSPEPHLMGLTPIKVANPMSREQEYLRTSLRAGLLSVLARNERYMEGGIRLFEIGKTFLLQEKDLPQEREMLCAVLSSLQPELSWQGKAGPVDFFVAKGIIETLSSRLKLVASFEASEDEGLYPGRSAHIIIDNKKIGVIGELHPKVSEAFELTESAYLIEIDLERLLPHAASPKKYQPTPRYPSMIRDIALLVDEQRIYQQIHTIIQDSPLVDQVALFDVYSGEQVPEGKKSLAFRITYQSATHTLTDEEVDEVQQQILDRLSRELGATLRA
ncbi:MAG TPA: phenylalanine--tRNA ligase subunit beta [Dehalococcoidia bacterium]|nr:phenylalanine--tRNA ligase subunit beta [Dehalococcoidia bacterium]